MVVLCLLLVPAAFVVSAALSWVLVRAGGRLGLMDEPGTESHKAHGRAVPNVGGLAIVAAVVGPLAAVLLLAWLMAPEAWSGWLSPLAEHAPGIRERSPELSVLLAALVGLHAVGLVDDRRSMGPAPKLAAQVVAAGALTAFFDIRVLAALGTWWGPVGTAVSVVMTVTWMIAVINAMNFLDNMDGLAAGVGAVIAGLYLTATLALPVTGGQWFDAGLAALLLGALLGFLPHNYPRARLFMGDGGSLVIGLALAVLSIRTTYLPDPTHEQAFRWHALLSPVVLMAVPLYDLASVTLLRLRHGRSPFSGDHNHFSHRLVRKGLRPPVAVAVVWLAALAAGLGGVLLPGLVGWQAGVAAGQAAAVLALLAILESSSPGRATQFRG